MCAYKAVLALRQLPRFMAPLLSLLAWMSLAEAQECRQLLPLPNLHADAIITGEIVQHCADEQSIDIAVITVLNGTLPHSKDCWRSTENLRTLTITTSALPEECSGVNTDKWTVGKQYILSLSINSATVCPSLLYDGLHSPILPAYPHEERARLRRQSAVCK